MAGRRLVDLAILASASASIARTHLAIRARQADRWSRTTSLGIPFQRGPRASRHTVKHQRQDQPGPVPRAPAEDGGGRARRGTEQAGPLLGGRDAVEVRRPEEDAKEGIGQDRTRALDERTAGHLKPRGDLGAHQGGKGMGPLSEGSTLTQGPDERLSNGVRALRGNRIQHTSEVSIPPAFAAPHLQQEAMSETTSNLPKEKIPRAAPAGVDPGADRREPEALEAQLFHSRRARRLFGGRGGPMKSEEEIKRQKEEEFERNIKMGQPQPSPEPKEIGEEIVEETEKIVGDRVAAKDIRALATDIEFDIRKTEVAVGPPHQAVQMTASRVPSSRIGRLFHYGGLAAGMAWGAASESLRRATSSDSNTNNSIMFSEANVERLVKKLSRMRGAALKLGQMMSIQDSNMLPPAIHNVLVRVQDSADYMPSSQRDKVLKSNLGKKWRELFSSFDETPMAAASIGQVHAAVLKSSEMPVAVKIQYPGVASSISSDLNNLSLLLTASHLLPKGLYLDKTIANARVELAWECDYVREANCARRFGELLKDDPIFRVPRIVDEASGVQVLTMERMHGTAVTKLIPQLTQSERDFIGTQLLALCFREIAQFRFMQTDPNWTNFLWNAQDRKIELLDFGASREYPAEFVHLYTSLLKAAARDEKYTVIDLSKRLGYLTGLESETMVNAHVTSILALAEPFSKRADEIYNFAGQTVTDRVRAQIPLMIRERLTPPPEETYSLHRKLSGAFLLCARLESRVGCRKIFEEALGG